MFTKTLVLNLRFDAFTETLVLNLRSDVPPVTCHLPPVTCHLSPVTCHLSPVTCHLSPVTPHLPPVALSPVTCNLSPVTWRATRRRAFLPPDTNNNMKHHQLANAQVASLISPHLQLGINVFRSQTAKTSDTSKTFVAQVQNPTNNQWLECPPFRL